MSTILTLIHLQVYDISSDPQPSPETRQSLLRDVRSVCNTYAQDRTRLENQLLAAQQTILALTAELGIADKKLTTLEDLIGEVCTRMHSVGSRPVQESDDHLLKPLLQLPSTGSTMQCLLVSL